MPERPDRDGDHQLSLLEAAWDQAARHWRDDMARDFDAQHWTPLRRETRHYLAALAGMMDVLAAAELETEF